MGECSGTRRGHRSDARVESSSNLVVLRATRRRTMKSPPTCTHSPSSWTPTSSPFYSAVNHLLRQRRKIPYPYRPDRINRTPSRKCRHANGGIMKTKKLRVLRILCAAFFIAGVLSGLGIYDCSRYLHRGEYYPLDLFVFLGAIALTILCPFLFLTSLVLLIVSIVVKSEIQQEQIFAQCPPPVDHPSPVAGNQTPYGNQPGRAWPMNPPATWQSPMQPTPNRSSFVQPIPSQQSIQPFASPACAQRPFPPQPLPERFQETPDGMGEASANRHQSASCEDSRPR